MSSDIHVNDTGTLIVITVQDENGIVSLASATSMAIMWKRPDGVVVSNPATLVTDGTDGQMGYTSQSGDFNLPGMYTLQGVVSLPPSGTFSTDTEMFKVYSNLM